MDNTRRPVLSAESDTFSKTSVIGFTICAYLTAGGLILGFSKGELFAGGTLTIPIPQLSQSVGIIIFRVLLTSGAGLFDGFWSDADLFYRASQPFASMYEENPQSASENILLDYLCSPPIIVSINAAMNSHFKVAYFWWEIFSWSNLPQTESSYLHPSVVTGQLSLLSSFIASPYPSPFLPGSGCSHEVFSHWVTWSLFVTTANSSLAPNSSLRSH